ncbi:sigma-70 family RNA polymerase sigma factor [Brevibacillus dissolubilis]|uniref:sigma-70 family RNA polymerase sigma factor n=1 Tax=Brevibacillus dissolubilis TaxID=1844116 RepID=UPI002100595A|nr:sigma-70 family RNA polymerase sigma factor [Brevibacillus dissolubilis]
MENVHRLQRTETADFDQVMRENGTKVLRLVTLFVKNQAVAEDITQEVFLKVYKNLPYFRGESSIQTWVYKIAVNESKSYLRSWSFRNIFAKDEIEQESGQNVEDEVIGKANRETVAELVLKMTPKYRQVIALRYYADLSIKEVAVALGESEGSVRTRLHRARAQLKKLVEKEGL